MTAEQPIAAEAPLVFLPRPSSAPWWILGFGLVLALNTVGLGLVIATRLPLAPSAQLVVGAVGGILPAVPVFLLALIPRRIRYEVHASRLTLRAPLIRYEIPLAEIEKVERLDLKISLIASFRLPGLALGGIYYLDVGTVRMCSTRAAQGVLLIHVGKAQYGCSPADEPGFVAAISRRA